MKKSIRCTSLALTSAVLLSMPLTMGGCLFSRSKEVSYSGSRVEFGDLSKVHLHRSTTSDVERLLGPPSSTVTNDDSSETWSWKWRKVTEGEGHVFLIFAGEKSKTEDHAVNIRFKDGVVVDKWRG